jgi:hypothetical protein
MINLMEWLKQVPEYQFVPLFETNKNLQVETRVVAGSQRKLLKRNRTMEDAVIAIVESGLNKEEWQGLFYIMGKGELENFCPMYIGKTEKKGTKNPISENIKNIRTNKGKFARWGDGNQYHIGDLSQVLFQFKSYQQPAKKYTRWAEAMFWSFDPPILKEQINLYLAPWYSYSKGPAGLVCSLPAAEKELISIASVQFRETLLNVDGV